jgi:hypothetical protein
VAAVVGNTSASISFVAPASNGGNPITSYTVVASDISVPANGGQTVTGPSSPLSLAGLTNGDTYTFVVVATNNVGNSVPSSASSPVVPTPPGPSQNNTPPYANALQFTVTKPINLTQLEDEIEAALAATVTNISLSGYTPPPSSISSGNPATLWVVPNTLNSSAVQTVINNHIANPNYGMPQQTQQYLAVVAAIQANTAITLTSTQLNTAVVGLVLQLESLFSGGNLTITP